MNHQLLDSVAFWLEAGGDDGRRRFNIGVGHCIPRDGGCGTVCCIAGFICDEIAADCTRAEAHGGVRCLNPATLSPHFAPEDGIMVKDVGWYFLITAASEALGIDEEMANHLFTPNFAIVDAAWAARVVRKLMATGEVDWYGTMVAEVPAAVRAIIDAAQEETHEHELA